MLRKYIPSTISYRKKKFLVLYLIGKKKKKQFKPKLFQESTVYVRCWKCGSQFSKMLAHVCLSFPWQAYMNGLGGFGLLSGSKPLPGTVPGTSHALSPPWVTLYCNFSRYPTHHMVALHARNHILKKALNLEFMWAVRAPPWGRSDFDSSLPSLTGIHCSLSTLDHWWPIHNTRIFLDLLD